MSKYIDTDKLIERLEEMKRAEYENCGGVNSKTGVLYEVQELIESLQQEQPIEGKQVIIITETDGDANIHWDCRSLDDVKALLASAQSFIADKQVEELRGEGSGPDYNTTEGRFRNAHKFQQEQPEVDLEEKIQDWCKENVTVVMPIYTADSLIYDLLPKTARHFYELGKARKEE